MSAFTVKRTMISESKVPLLLTYTKTFQGIGELSFFYKPLKGCNNKIFAAHRNLKGLKLKQISEKFKVPLIMFLGTL